jgi:hypothetical protein
MEQKSPQKYEPTADREEENVPSKDIVPNSNVSSAPNINSNKKVLKIVIIFSPILLYIISRLLVLFVISPLIAYQNNYQSPRVNKQVNSSFDDIESKTGLKSFATSTVNACSKDISILGLDFFPALGGSDYYEKCTLIVSKYYGFSGDFKKNAFNLEKDMFELGWNDNLGISDKIRIYYDENVGKYMDSSSVPKELFTVSNLNSAGYTKDGYRLEINFAQKESTAKDIDFIKIYESKAIIEPHGSKYKTKQLQNIDDIFKNIILENKYFMMMTISKHY